MNFDSMPELHWRYGYPAALLLMLTLVVLVYRALRKNNWL
jgi:magnesium transporter